jgi:hypothetical protein
MSKEEVLSHSEKDKLLRLSEVSLILKSYQGIFSDFDPRPYAEKALSEDFIHEARRAVKDKPFGKFQLKFLIPKSIRNTSEEKVIKNRLRAHFIKHFYQLELQKKALIREGLLFTLVGVILMTITSFALLEHLGKNILINFLVVLFEPASWFLFWEGLNQAVFEARKIRPHLDFYLKMSNIEIEFVGI